MSRPALKGFLLSLDALVAVGLILVLVLFLGGLSLTYYSPELRYQRLYFTGRDIILLVENSRIEQLQEFGVIQYYLGTGILTGDDMDKSLLDVVGSMWVSDNATLHGYASNITDHILNQTIPANLNYDIILGGDSIDSRGSGGGDFLARLNKVVSGIQRGKPTEGFFARVYPSLVGDFRTLYRYFGGYVGQGNITVLVELPDYDDILSMEMEFDAGDDFELLINGQQAGYYQRVTNESMRSNSWDVDPSHFAKLQEGTNNISIQFPDGGSYLGGGYMKFVYNISNLTYTDPVQYGYNATSTYFLPGIDGIVNLYSSFYVPGSLNSLDAFIHFDSDIVVTKYLAIGNATVLQTNETGELNITLTNQSIAGNISDSGFGYDLLSVKTVPIRFGLKNVSYILGEAGFVDVVLITDRTGSMTYCDVDVSCAPGLCDPFYPCHDRRSNVVTESDKEFINTILSAEGNNYVGLLGYGERHGLTCSFHEISNSNSSLQERVSDYNYGGSWESCGGTCTSCGVVGATELLQENEALYNLTLRQDINRSVYSLSGNSQTVYLDIGTLNASRFVKSRFSIFVRGENLESGYQDCIFLNGQYLGRACKSSESNNGWHSCSYVVEEAWLQEGSNAIQVTAGGSGGCFSGGGEGWEFKDAKLMVWEFRGNESVVATNSSSEEMLLNQAIPYIYAEVPEEQADFPNPVDFTSGLNTSGNTFGLGLAEDGWDWQEQTYGFTGPCGFNGATGGMLEIYTMDNSNPKSCSYGVEFNVTPEIYSFVQAGGKIGASLYYEWEASGNFEPQDEASIKGRIASPSGTACEDPEDCYLGEDTDSLHNGGDSSFDIYSVDNPDTEFSGNFFQDITSWIEAPGIYYIDIGGKLLNNANGESGYFRFDNVSVSVYNISQPYVMFSYPGVNMSTVKAATLRLEARDIDPEYFDCVYVNGYHLGMLDYQEYNESGDWEDVRFDVSPMYLSEGENEILFTGGTEEGCNRTGDNDKWDARNVELSLVHGNESHDYLRKKSMLIMSDGEANTRIGDCYNYDTSSCPEVTGWETPSEETVTRACEAHDTYNISIYAIAFGNAGQDAIDMLQAAACCDNCTHFYTSNDADELRQIYSQIAQGIINSSWVNQTLEVSQDVGVISRLFPDSYIRINYSSVLGPPVYGEVRFNFESPRLSNMSGNETITDNATSTKEGWFFVPDNIEVIEAVVTSYSSQFWTDRLYVKNASSGWSRAFWLSDFAGLNYTGMGDPFKVNIPVGLLGSGNNSVRIGTGYGPDNGTGGSPDSRIIYTGRMQNITLEGYSDVFPRAEGCTYDAYYDIDGDNVSDGFVRVGIGLNPSDMFDPMNDSLDHALLRFLDVLNVVWDSDSGGIGDGTPGNPWDGDITNPIDFQITPELDFESAFISGVPSLWGPVKLEVHVWT